MTEQAAKGVIRRLTVSIVAIVLLTAALTVTTFILVVNFRASVLNGKRDAEPERRETDCLCRGMHVCARAEHGKKFYGGKPQHLRGVV